MAFSKDAIQCYKCNEVHHDTAHVCAGLPMTTETQALKEAAEKADKYSMNNLLTHQIKNILLTIKAHCTVIAEPAESDPVADLAYCIKLSIDESLRPRILFLIARLEKAEAALKLGDVVHIVDPEHELEYRGQTAEIIGMDLIKGKVDYTLRTQDKCTSDGWTEQHLLRKASGTHP
jgi:hypothetical protein